MHNRSGGRTRAGYALPRNRPELRHDRNTGADTCLLCSSLRYAAIADPIQKNHIMNMTEATVIEQKNRGIYYSFFFNLFLTISSQPRR